MALFNLRKAGYEVTAAEDGAEGLSAFAASPFDLVITDLKMPGIPGMEVLRKIHAGSPDVPVLVITAFGNVETAVAAMKEGAYDFIGKPFHRDQLLLAVGKALDRRRLADEVRDLRIRASGVGRDVVSVSAAMRRLLELSDRVAASEATVLITGESGTGKEVLALVDLRRPPGPRGRSWRSKPSMLPISQRQSTIRPWPRIHMAAFGINGSTKTFMFPPQGIPVPSISSSRSRCTMV